MAQSGEGTTIISWNINSVRLRLVSLRRLAETYAPHVVCLQETKCPDEAFPAMEIAAAGFPHQAVRGEKGVNGVAILSRLPLADINHQHWAGREDCRHIAGRLPNGIMVDNFYVPAGGDVADAKQNPKFAHKLQFLKEMTTWTGTHDASQPRVMLGDLNVAPRADDVWSHKALLNVVSHTPLETEALGRLLAAGEWCDAVRQQIPDGKLYSWWSYRAHDWRTSDRGRRLDHIWVTPPLVKRIAKAEILKAVRGWDTPSDHAPVAVTLAEG